MKRQDEAIAKKGPVTAAPDIDFHSPEFNRIDDLQDCVGNFRSFEALEGVVTADMRHQMERRSAAPAPSGRESLPPSGSREPKEDAEAAGGSVEPVVVVSRGRILIVGSDDARALSCARVLIAEGLSCTLVVTGREAAESPSPLLGHAALREAAEVSITGAFGGFAATATLRSGGKTRTERLCGEGDHFDCVLDLQASPSYASELLPPGYYASGLDPADLERALAELPEMRGRFEKPKFTAFLESRCLHGRSRVDDCRRCLDVCPFGAIRERDGRIRHDPALCQGCGGCALVCSPGAFRAIHPSPAEQLDLLRRFLETRPAAPGSPLTLFISDEAAAGGTAATFEVEQIGQVRLELLLFALVYGAVRVVVDCGTHATPLIREAVRRQTLLAAAILRGMGMPEEKVRFAASDTQGLPSTGEAVPLREQGARAALPATRQAPCPAPGDGRSLVRQAAQVLYARSGSRQPSIPLPPGAPFGAVALDAARCTLCMACAAACPAGALTAREDAPRLEFREALCHQCGLCRQTCPESALTLLPRMLCDPLSVDTPAVLGQAEAARCLDCGVPFAPTAMIDRMRERLQGHWMYAGERQMRRLQLCRTCRTRDALASGDAREWSR